MEVPLYRCHDYGLLVRRWQKVARRARLEWRVFADASGYDLFALTTPGPWEREGIYISAGIHGDEPAGTEGLIRWAEADPKRLRAFPFCLFPCLNPWGLVNNSRLDKLGRDLNRTFHHDDVPQIQALKALIRPYRFTLALTLHEDYDGHGLYLYEGRSRPPFWGEELLEFATPLIPIEGRMTIDGRRASKAGLVRRRFDPRKYPQTPEAIYLHRHHARHTFTFETPSEFALDVRVRAQIALIEECVRRATTL